MVMESMRALGCEAFVAVGSCGDLAGHPQDTFVCVSAALRDEGTSAHYQPEQPWAPIADRCRTVLRDARDHERCSWVEATTWTTDAMFRETLSKVAGVEAQYGCDVVDMECAALASVAAHHRVPLAQLLYPQDTLADALAASGAGSWQPRRGTGTGPQRRDIALRVARRAASKLAELAV